MANEPARKYGAAELQRALTTLAHNNGNVKRTVKALKSEVGVSARQLTRWREENADEYERIRRDIMPAVREQEAENLMARVGELGELEADLIVRNRAEVPNLKPGEASTALRNASVSKAISYDKAKDLRGGDVPPQQNPPFEETVEHLKRLAGGPAQLARLLGLPVAEEAIETEVIGNAQTERRQLEDGGERNADHL